MESSSQSIKDTEDKEATNFLCPAQNEPFLLAFEDEIQNESLRNFGLRNMDYDLKSLAWSEDNSMGFSKELLMCNNDDTQPKLFDDHLVPDLPLSPPPLLSPLNPEQYNPSLLYDVPNINVGAFTSDQNEQNEELDDEMTLEDFLVELGVIKPSTKDKHVHGLDHNIHGTSAPSFTNTTSKLNENGYLAPFDHVGSCSSLMSIYPMVPPAPPVGNEGHIGNNDEHVVQGHFVEPSCENQQSNNKRKGGEVLSEEAMEHRRQRMIKKRESAARLRARKQVYILNLETELHKLKMENQILKLNLAEAESRKQELEDDGGE